MTETNNPFAAPEKRPRGGSGGAFFAWLIALLMTCAAGAALWFWHDTTLKQQAAIETIWAQFENTGLSLSNALVFIRTNQEFVSTLTNQISSLQAEKDAAGAKVKTLEDEMRSELESKDVTISKLQGKLTVSIVDRVMFDSGEAVLKEDGATVMQKIAGLLATHPELNIHVIGHTDNVPIRQSVHNRFASNWELSTARALAAVHFLTEKAGVDPRRVGAVGYGEFRPIADNSTAEGRAANRRIAVTILPEELLPLDAPIKPPGPPVTNAPSAEVSGPLPE